MKFPKRTPEHISESVSFQRLSTCLPDGWILRHVTERDYGIDCLVEPVSEEDGEVRGYLMSIQIKSKDSIGWRENDDPTDKKSTFSGVKVSTVNYWMNLPTPVFLCVHEKNTDSLYFCPVESQARSNFDLLTRQDSLGFTLNSDLDLSDSDKYLDLLRLYFKERKYKDFSSSLRDLLQRRDDYIKQITLNVDRDSHMAVEPSQMIWLRQFYKTVKTVTMAMGSEWPLQSWQDYKKQDQEEFGDWYKYFREGTQNKILHELTPLFLNAVEKGSDHVLTNEYAYWNYHFPLLVEYIEREGIQEWLNYAHNELGNII